MRYRWKLLVLLLVIALVPLVTLRFMSVRALKKLDQNLAFQLHQSRDADAKRRLELLADNYVTVLRQGFQKTEMALIYQTRELEKILVKAGELPDESALVALIPVYREIQSRFEGVLLWQHMALTNGFSYSYAAHSDTPVQVDAHSQCWYRQALENGMTWSTPYRDTATGKTVIAAMMKIRGADGRNIGVSALVFTIESILPDAPFRRHLPSKTDVFIVAANKFSAPKNRQVKVLICKTYADMADSRAEDLQLPADGRARAEIVSDFEKKRGNTQRAGHQGRDSLWVYRPILSDLFTVFITPYEAIFEPSQKARAYVTGLIEDMVRYTTYGLLGTVLVVIFLALAFSRTVTRPISHLLEASLRLGGGDLSARVDIRSRDEFGDLGRVFNSVVALLQRGSKIQQSLAVAVEVQQNLIPKQDPVVPGLDIAGKSIFCEGAGGDYFDYINAGQKESRKIGLVVGDVSDHGLPSALLMATARAALRQRAQQEGPLSAVVSDVNRQLCKDVEESGRFMSLFICEIDAGRKSVTWVRAGHDPALLFDPLSDRFDDLAGDGLPLGVFEDTIYQQKETGLRQGQILIIGTDGIWETRRAQGDLFGKERLMTIVRQNVDRPAKAIVAAIFDALADFRQPLKPDDDITLVVAKIEAKENSSFKKR